MPREYSRTQRVADLIQHELAVLIQREVKDPRIGMVTVSAVEVSKDLAHAKVYITVLGEAEQVDVALETLNNAASYLRMLLAKTVKLRSTPELKFLFDASVSYGSKMSSLIDKAIAEDEKRKNKRGDE